MVIVVIFVYLYNYSENLPITVGTRSIDLAERRQYSNAFRIAGFYAGFKAISESPVIGLGSWAKSNSIFAYWTYMRYQAGGNWDPPSLMNWYRELPEKNSIQTHSEIIQAWVEAGISGFVFLYTFLLCITKCC